MSHQQVKIILKKGKEESLRRFHPWVFSGAIAKITGDADDGCIVEVFSASNEFIASGHYQHGSISVRVLSFEKRPIDQDFWNNRIFKAFSVRKKLGLAQRPGLDVYRLIHGEGDGLPGLIVDYYNGTAVIQTHSIGMHKELNKIVSGLREVLGEDLVAIYNKSTSSLPSRYSELSSDGYLWGKPVTRLVTENGCQFRVDWEQGQKTGFFIDQRESRQLLLRYSANRTVLNLFGYTGGFSVYAARGGAGKVITVDSSKPAIELANENMRINGYESLSQTIVSDVFDFFASNHSTAGIVVLDPPAFAKHTQALKVALQGYKKLNVAGFRMVEPGGLLFTFSCSQVVSRSDFRKTVFTAAAIAKRNVRIIHQLSQPADHPVNIYHPEGEYLKGLVLYVE